MPPTVSPPIPDPPAAANAQIPTGVPNLNAGWGDDGVAWGGGGELGYHTPVGPPLATIPKARTLVLKEEKEEKKKKKPLPKALDSAKKAAAASVRKNKDKAKVDPIHILAGEGRTRRQREEEEAMVAAMEAEAMAQLGPS